ncbi:MAG: hypothetical protein V1926_04860 [Candidatus Peregrinibacteria bacterium]
MLLKRFVDYFASKQSLAERRYLCFANTNDQAQSPDAEAKQQWLFADAKNIEKNPETESQQETSPAASIENVRSGVAGLIVEAAPDMEAVTERQWAHAFTAEFGETYDEKIRRKLRDKHIDIPPEEPDPFTYLSKLEHRGELPAQAQKAISETIAELLEEDTKCGFRFAEALERSIRTFDQWTELLNGNADEEPVTDGQGKRELLSESTPQLLQRIQTKSAQLETLGKSFNTWMQTANLEEVRRELGLAPLHAKDKPAAFDRVYSVLKGLWSKDGWALRLLHGKVNDESPEQTRTEAQNTFRKRLAQDLETVKASVLQRLREHAQRTREQMIADRNERMEPFVGQPNARFLEATGVNPLLEDEVIAERIRECDRVLPSAQEALQKAAEESQRARAAGSVPSAEEMAWEQLQPSILERSRADFLEEAEMLYGRLTAFSHESAFEEAKRRTQEQEQTHERDKKAYDAAAEALAKKADQPDFADRLGLNPETAEFLRGTPDEDEVQHCGRDGTKSRLAQLTGEDVSSPQTQELIERMRAGDLSGLDLSGMRQLKEREARAALPDIQKRLEAIEADIRRIQDIEACHFWGIDEQMTGFMRTLASELELARNQFQDPNSRILAYACESVSKAAFWLPKLEEVAAYLRNPPAPRMQALGTHGPMGYFNHASKEIIVNTDRCKNDRRTSEAVNHERGHAVLDLLTSKKLLTGLGSFYQTCIATEPEAEKGTFERLFAAACRNKWGRGQPYETEVTRLLGMGRGRTEAEASAREKYRDMFMGELMTSYATACARRQEHRGTGYTPDKDPEFSEEERMLFAILDKQNGKPAPLSAEAEKAVEGWKSHFDIDPDDPDAAGGGGGGGAESIPSLGLDVRQTLLRIAEQITAFREFLKVSDFQNDLLPLAPYIDKFATRHRNISNMSEEEQLEPENLPTLKAEVNELDEVISKYIRQKREEPAHAEVTRRFKWVWVNGWDMIAMFKDGWEDIKKNWKRASEHNRNIIGENITSIIPERLWYVGQIRHEYHRRAQSSELDEIGNWEKALENVDSYDLLASFADMRSSKNKDRCRATVQLLTKRGLMDWGNEDFWRTLNRFSHYRMPIEACRANAFIRNEWLQKMIGDIWADNEMYFTWSAANNSGFKNHREDFHVRTTVLAGTRGELANELEYQLRTWMEYKEEKKHNPHAHLPPRVNPHFYEKVIQYSILAGKMNMAQKFYYLIQGIASGLLPLDRLHLLNTEVLGQFPFIDYFSSQHNSKQEIQALAERLREEDPNMLYKAGNKTAVWLMTELASDEEARRRAAKVISRSSDTLDHEDIPMLVTQMGHGDMDELLKVMTGAKQRVTVEGRKNGYTGFGTFFKTYGYLAKIKDGTLTRHEAQNIAAKIVSYCHYDNIIINAATDGQNRCHLTRAQIENESMPSGGTESPKFFRDKVNGFVSEVFREYGIDSVEADIPKTQKGAPAKETVSMEEYLGGRRDAANTWNQSSAGQTALFYATGAVLEALTNAIARDPNILTRILIDHRETMQGDCEVDEESVRKIYTTAAKLEE